MTSILDVFTVPAKQWVTPESSGVWGVDFANMLRVSETITSTTARIVATLTRSAVTGAVIAAAKDGTTVTRVNVQWDASLLVPGTPYRLETTATLSTGTDDLVLYTDLIVV